MCTTMIVGKNATVDGSMMVAHSDDDELSDQRVIFVPRREVKPGGSREVILNRARYPRIVSKRRGPYYDTGGEPSKVIGHVPWEFLFASSERSHTAAYFDGNFGICNEYNLMIGECTNGTKFRADPVSEEEAKEHKKQMRLFYTDELSRIALECCRHARQAVHLMGKVLDTYGYYGSGETLLVADENEGWVFEVCSLDSPAYTCAWVAQRVKDDELFVAANEFRIRNIEASDDFIYPDDLLERLDAVGYWSPDQGRLDWLRAVSFGEYNHPYYSLRRVWRVMDRVNPDYGLSPWVTDGSFTTDYPFSIKPNRKLSLEDILSLYRDHYEGTQFDLTRGVAAGPYGDPHRFTAGYDGDQNNVTAGKQYYGAWERAISVFYQGYTYVAQVRPHAPEATKGICWFGPDVAYTTCFTPFFTKVTNLPKAYQIGSPQKFEMEVAWWLFDFVNSWSRLNFQRMTQVDIKPLQAELERLGLDHIAKMDAEVQAHPEDAITRITGFSTGHAEKLLNRWCKLACTLIAKYSDGYINLPDQKEPQSIGYPSNWLAVTNYAQGPTTYEMRPLHILGTDKES